MSWRLFAMDTHFKHSLGTYEFDARCEMVKELGYDATYLSLLNEPAWNDLPRLASVKTKHDLDVAGVWLLLDGAGDDNHAGNLRVLRAIETTEGCDHFELSIRTSDTTITRSDAAGDAAATRWLERLLTAADKRGATISLYPHINFWLERIEDAVRLCRQFNHPRLRAVFCGFHWYAVDGKNLGARLAEAQPFLRSVNLCGTRKLPEAKLPTIEPLDSGELDHFAVLGRLREIGYAGMIGFQGYGMGGDVYTNLQRSIRAFRDLEGRLQRHPNWAKLQ
ncbi:MAG: hypothetical protein PCFJNLEI_00571 [Verrucomicrobiae bacterium]|nr:hypothetical protein [Verrucomicrobiae bacterium]